MKEKGTYGDEKAHWGTKRAQVGTKRAHVGTTWALRDRPKFTGYPGRVLGNLTVEKNY